MRKVFTNTFDVVNIFQINTIETLPITTEQLVNETSKNTGLKQIVTFLPKAEKFRSI